MTDQTKSNSISAEEPVTEFTLCDNFIRQYKKFKLGMLEGDFFSQREQQALTASSVGTPELMQAFIATAVHILTEKAKVEFPSIDEVMECVAYFNSAIFGVVYSVVIPLLKMPEDQKSAIRQHYQKMLADALEEKKGTEAPLFDGLDFAMPNVDLTTPPAS
jgi:hypothetical protein